MMLVMGSSLNDRDLTCGCSDELCSKVMADENVIEHMH